MKTLLLIFSLLILCGCTSKTEHGDCIGLNADKNPDLKYEYSVRNIFWGIVGFELIAPPLFVVFDQIQCPVGNK